MKSDEGASSSSWKYDVFVSFRGEDIRKTFADHLFTELERKPITIFRDDRSLESGKPISVELLKAMEESRFFIVVFSRNYATSSWCLDELAKIVECMKDTGRTVYPLFYDVSPTVVRKQIGSFGKAFDEHEKYLGAEKLKKWRGALTEVANLSGSALEGGYEAKFIEDIVEKIWHKLSQSFSDVTKGFVGIDTRLKEMDSYLEIGLHDVRIIGICGMGGIGKTTIAKVIHDKYSHQFHASSFLSSIREESEKRGLESLQEQLLLETSMEKSRKVQSVHRGIHKWLGNRRVLIVLDDIDKLQQLEKLAGDHDWFGGGSRIIITTRDKHLLIAHNVDKIYEVNRLNTDEALQLFCFKAFNQNHPKEDYVKLSNLIVSYANGLPLALRVLGSCLRGLSLDEWSDALVRLREVPEEALEKKIFNVLKISYDGLKEIEKKIFLDISCMFNRTKKNRVIEILEACEFYPKIGLRVLIDKTLVSINGMDEELYVHSLLQEMARNIVYQESPGEPGRRSRLWRYKDVRDVLEKKTGTEAVEVIHLNWSQSKEISADADAFVGMINLRLLKIHGVQLREGLNFLSNELRILEWHKYPLKSLPSTFKPEKLVELHLSHSGIELLWKKRVDLPKLKVISLNHSRKLTRTPDFSGVPNLERLILEGCTSLSKVHTSIGDLEKLSVLNLKDCESLQSLPRMVRGWRSLKVLLLLGCSKLVKLPENLGDCENLEELDAGKTAIREVPPSIPNLKNLKELSFRGCKRQTLKRKRCNWFPLSLPSIGPCSKSLSLPSLAGLSSLTKLDLSYSNLSAIPSDIGSLSSLVKLYLTGNEFVSLPSSIKQLSRLEELELVDCQNLQTLSELPSSILCLKAYNCSSLKTLFCPLGFSPFWCRAFDFQNCFRLLDNQGNDDGALSLLKQHLVMFAKIRIREIFSLVLDLFKEQEGHDPQIVNFICQCMRHLSQETLATPDFSDANPILEIFIPGGSISDWFTHRSTDDCIYIELPNSDFRLLGVAVCASFEVENDIQKRREPQDPWFKNDIRFQGEFSFEIFDSDRLSCFSDTDMELQSDHLWLLFVPWNRIHTSEKELNNFSGGFYSMDPNVKFKMCGARAVYLKDIEFVQTTFQGLNVPRLEDIIQLGQSQVLSWSGSSDEDRDEDIIQLGQSQVASGSGSSDEDGDETRESIDPESIDPIIELKGKRIQQ